MAAFLKTTILGGILFLLPLAIVLMILGYPARARGNGGEADCRQARGTKAGAMTWPASGLSPCSRSWCWSLFRLAPAWSPAPYLGARMTRWFENSLLGRLPQYQMLKSMAEGLVQLETASGIKPALINIEDALADGLPARAARRTAGRVSFCPRRRHRCPATSCICRPTACRPLDLTMVDAMAIIKRIGVGSGDALRGVDLKLPAG